MTETIEGVLKSISRWANGKGGDVELSDDDVKYYFEGSMDLVPFLGKHCELEVVDGSGEHEKEKEIVDCKEPSVNPAVPMPKMMPNQPPGRRMIQLPFEEFQAMLTQKLAVSEVKKLSLEAAVRVYAAMGKIEKDPKAAAQEVVVIATKLSGYLA